MAHSQKAGECRYPAPCIADSTARVSSLGCVHNMIFLRRFPAPAEGRTKSVQLLTDIAPQGQAIPRNKPCPRHNSSTTCRRPFPAPSPPLLLVWKAASFGFHDGERAFCSAHKRPGMEYLKKSLDDPPKASKRVRHRSSSQSEQWHHNLYVACCTTTWTAPRGCRYSCSSFCVSSSPVWWHEETPHQTSAPALLCTTQ